MPACLTAEKLLLPQSFGVDQQQYNQFLKKCTSQNHIQYAVFTFPFLCNDPLPFLKMLDSQNEFKFYYEKPNQQKAMAAGGAVADITASGSDRFIKVDEAIKSVKNETLHFNGASTDSGIHFLGGFSFFDEVEAEGWHGFKTASFILPKRLIVKKEGRSTLSIGMNLKENSGRLQIHKQLLHEFEKFKENTPVKDSFAANGNTPHSAVKSAISIDDWNAAIIKAKRNIAEKAFNKVVLARELNLSSSEKYNAADILNRLRNQYPKCCTYLVQRQESQAFIGSSPERLISFQNNSFQTEALAGSMPRGANEKEDKIFENKLMKSGKNREEHFAVINYIKEKVLSRAQDVEAPKNLFVKKLSNVQHLFTPLKFKVSDEVSPLQILNNLHPTPALGGYPRKEAVDYLSKHCLINRGWFGSPVGWMNTNGGGEFSVAIRSGLIGEHSARLFAGCGIVADSNPEKEWEESKLKFIPMLSALNYG